jgi:hypothetical protein
MTGAPDAEFAKIFELLNEFERLDDSKQRAFLKPAEPPADALMPFASETLKSVPKVHNHLAANIMAAMAKCRN